MQIKVQGRSDQNTLVALALSKKLTVTKSINITSVTQGLCGASLSDRALFPERGPSGHRYEVRAVVAAAL